MEVIIVGAGASVKEGMDKELWDKLQNKEVWSLNSVYKCMPYLPKKQFWVDIEFFNHEIDNLQKLHEQKVLLYSKEHPKFAFLKDKINQYPTTREQEKYYGKDAIAKNLIYYGRMGLCGMFALSMAVALGYTTIYLLGYDFGAPTLGHKFTHWYQEQIGRHDIMSSGAGRPEVYIHKESGAEGKIRDEVNDFNIFLKETDIKIYNISLLSHIPTFQKVSYDEFFKLIA